MSLPNAESIVMTERSGLRARNSITEGRRLAGASLLLNVLLTAAKYLLFLMTGSYAILAETVHSLTDVIGSILVVGGIVIAEKKSSRFPWGLYKVENLAAVFSAGLIFVSAVGITKEIVSPMQTDMRNLDVALAALLVMAIPIVLFTRYEARVARRINSPALAADAENWRMDLAPLAVVAAGIAGARFSYPFMDRLAAMIVLVLVVRAGYGILVNSMKSLLDASVDRETLERIRRAAVEFPQVGEVVSLQARNSGRYIFAYLDVKLSLKKLKDAYDVARQIEIKILERVPSVERVIVSYEPVTRDYRRYAVGLETRDGRTSEHFGRAPFIALWDRKIPGGKLLSKEIVSNPYSKMEKGKGIKLAELLVERGTDVVFTREDFTGKGPEYVFSDADIETRKTNSRDMVELMGGNESM
jgi:cation diffusion facilitator family transporter